MAGLHYAAVGPAPEVSDLEQVGQHMLGLMLRNVASDGFAFPDPLNPGAFSRPGCIIASPSYPADLSTVDQDYVFNWTRDAAIAAIELVAAGLPTVQPLVDYTTFAWTCQQASAPDDRACYTIQGAPRDWTDQGDGPALRTIALLQAYPLLDSPTRTTAQAVITQDLNFLLGAYQNATYNLWEEHSGYSFFARSVQLRCLNEIKANTFGLPVPAGIDQAIAWLESALAGHWDGQRYVSLLPAPPNPPPTAGYDPNIDIVLAAIYGAVDCADPRLLATAAQLRAQWADGSSSSYYPINGDDQARGFGPMLGRYPADSYDGDVRDPVPGGHPWALCTCNFAELYYRLAAHIGQTHVVPLDPISGPFFTQIGVGGATSAASAVDALVSAGDAMLRAVVFHSDHLELSEQFDGSTGFEKSVRNLTWSYAAFLSAVRARGNARGDGASPGIPAYAAAAPPEPGGTLDDTDSRSPLQNSLAVGHAALRGLAATERLLLLDDLWTTYVERANRADVRRDLPSVEALVSDMTAGLRDVRAATEAIRPVLDAAGDEAVDRAVQDAVRDDPEGEELISFLREATQPEGLRAAILAAADYLTGEADSELRLLEEQLGALRSDAEAAGDLRLSMKCAVYLVKTGCYVVGTGLLGAAAGVANPLVLVGTIAVEAGVVIDAVKGWKESDCRRHRPQPATT